MYAQYFIYKNIISRQLYAHWIYCGHLNICSHEKVDTLQNDKDIIQFMIFSESELPRITICGFSYTD